MLEGHLITFIYKVKKMLDSNNINLVTKLFEKIIIALSHDERLWQLKKNWFRYVRAATK